MRSIAIAVATISLGLAGCAAGPVAAPRSSDPSALGALVLLDVRTGAAFTLAQLAAERPVLLETMAIWCTNCRGQQHQVADAHGLADFDSISLDVDPNERPADLADYADREGFDWRFAVADADLARLLRDQFGSAVLNPPSMPKILFRTDGSVELIGLGQQLSASELAAILDG
jgi:thiol-disulfide isomerase/thioredoxin